MNKVVINNAKVKQSSNIKKLLTFPNINNYIVLIITALIISIVVSAFFWTKSVSYNTLYNNLSNEDQESIIRELTKMDVPYHLNEKSGSILVPENIVYKLRVNLAKNGFPKERSVGFELLDKQGFGVSQFNEQINYQRALEGELSRTIQKLDVVKSARVHLGSFPSVFFLDKRKELSVGIILELQYGKTLEFEQIQSIVHLVSSSIENLSIHNISIIDQYGHLLNQPGNEFNELNNIKTRYCSELEKIYSRKIEDILLPLFGPGNIYAKVTAQVDFNIKESTEEKYNPNFLNKDQSIRSHQQLLNSEPINLDDANSDRYISDVNDDFRKILNKKNIIKNKNILKKNAYNITNNLNVSGKKNCTNDNRKRSIHYEDTINYELNKIISHTKLNGGEIKRLSVAIVVNYLKDVNKKFIPLSALQLDQVKQLAKEAVGYSEKRGDTITVVNSLFFSPKVFFKYNEKITNNVISKELLKFITFIFLFILVIFLAVWLILLKITKKLINKTVQKTVKQKFVSKMIKERNKNVINDQDKSYVDNVLKYDNDELIQEICQYDSRILTKIIRYWINEKS